MKNYKIHLLINNLPVNEGFSFPSPDTKIGNASWSWTSFTAAMFEY